MSTKALTARQAR
jgi:hypothetical protein